MKFEWYGSSYPKNIPNKQIFSNLNFPDVCIMCNVCVQFRRIWLFETTWTVAHQSPLSMEFSR